MALLPAKTLEVVDETAHGNSTNPLKSMIEKTIFQRAEKDEIFRIFWAWTAAFFLMEPILSLLVLPKGEQPLTMVSVLTDYTYGSVTFLNAVYVYKYIFKKPTFFPTTPVDLPLFVSIHALIQLAFDIVWLTATGKISWNYPLKDLLQKYTKVKKISHSVHVITYGIVWVNVAFFYYNYLRPLEWISTIIGSAFLMLLLEV